MKRTTIVDVAVRKDSSEFFKYFRADTPVIFEVMITAEDRRARRHNGIDWISIMRAIIFFPKTRSLRGISTIEQQYVRTVIRRQGNLWLCKFKELYDSWQLASRVSKEEIWAAYLWRAYYGAGMSGYRATREKFEIGGCPLNHQSAAQIIACLKYPRPQNGNPAWSLRHSTRVAYIRTRLTKKDIDALARGTPHEASSGVLP